MRRQGSRKKTETSPNAHNQAEDGLDLLHSTRAHFENEVIYSVSYLLVRSPLRSTKRRPQSSDHSCCHRGNACCTHMPVGEADRMEYNHGSDNAAASLSCRSSGSVCMRDPVDASSTVSHECCSICQEEVQEEVQEDVVFIPRDLDGNLLRDATTINNKDMISLALSQGPLQTIC